MFTVRLGSGNLLSAECGGRRCVRSVHGTYLRALHPEWKVNMAPHRRQWEQWTVEDRGGRVAFKAIHSDGRYLRGNPDGKVDLAGRPQEWEMWTPQKNTDGSYSFRSTHGKWLSARKDGHVMVVNSCASSEHFWLERW